MTASPDIGFGFNALLPVFLIVLLGLALRATGLVRPEQWGAIDHVCYYVLFPAIIVRAIATADLTGVPVAAMVAAIVLGLLTMIALLLGLRRPLSRLLGLAGPAFSSFFQGSTRFHTFIMLAIVPAILGTEALALAALAAITMIPVLNVASVIVVSVLGRGAAPSVSFIARQLATNPFILASLAGILLKVLVPPLPEPIVQSLDLVGRGALGLALLTTGAGLTLHTAISAKAPVTLAVVLKLLVLPAVIGFWTWVFGIGGMPQAVAILAAAVPTGAGSYILARQLGGDAPLIAGILTAQVAAAAVTLPIVVAFAL
ncbi:MAG TPA: AEC family transporter [Aestuariivirgaceae bacterium]|nr:AEC family transporter [Aestuariivirgaceae bacterium]